MDEERLLPALIDSGLMLPDEPWTVYPASGGLNTRVYRAVRPGSDSDLAIRMFDDPVNLEREVAAIREVSGCPGVPQVRHAGGGILVHDYIPGQPQPLDAVDADAIHRLCDCLVCIHHARHAHYTHWPSGEVRHGSRRDLFLERRTSLSAPLQGITDATAGRIAEIKQWLDSLPLDTGSWLEAEFSRLHGDLSRGNILWAEDSVGLIDWEFTRIGDPAEELAYLITEQPVDSARQSLIHDSYVAAGGSSATWDRVPEYCAFAALDSAIWWVGYLQSHGEGPAGHPEVDFHLDVAEQWMAGDGN